MRRWVIGLGVTILAGGIAACEDRPVQEPDVVDEEPEMAEIKPRPTFPEPADPAISEPQAVGFPIWPGRGDWTTFELMWLGGDGGIDLYEEPRDDAEVIGQASWLDGEEFGWTDTLVFVEQPRPYRVEESLEVVATPYDVEFAELEVDEAVFELEKGDLVYLYQYGGDDTCYLGIEGEIVLGNCPGSAMSVEDEEGLESDDVWKPIAEEWWIEVEVDDITGWFRVADAPVEIHPRKSEGFEDLEHFDEYEDYDHPR